MIYKVLTIFAATLAVAAGLPVEKRLALLEAKVGVLREALAEQVSADDVDEQRYTAHVTAGDAIGDVAKGFFGTVGPSAAAWLAMAAPMLWE